MKYFYFFLFFILALNSFAQTKDETIQWINNNIHNGLGRSAYWGHINLFFSVDINGNFKLREQWNINDKHYDPSKRNKIINYIYSGKASQLSLSDINVGEATNIFLNDLQYIEIKCFNNVDCITRIDDYKNERIKVNSVIINYNRNENNISPRTITALKHFIKLYGGKQSSF